jgi:spore maturation protein CgeB
MRRGLRMAFFGSSLVSAYWNGAATYYRGIIRALYDDGHQITFYEPDVFERQAHRDIPDPPWARVVVYSSASEEAVYRVLEEARGADLIIKASGVGGVFAPQERAVLEMRRDGALAVFWDVDAPATLDRVLQNPDDPFRRLISRYDLILTYGGGEPVVKAYTALGAQACIPIYNALDPSTHYPVAPDPRFIADLGFLGHRMPDREARVEEFLFGAASEAPEHRFLLGGNGWDSKLKPTNVTYIGHVYTYDHNAFNCSSRAILNINRASMARYGFSPPTRIFEAAGVGACLITDAWEGIECFLEPDHEVIIVHDGSELAKRLRVLTPARACAIGAAARRRLLAKHTYRHRAKQLAALLPS